MVSSPDSIDFADFRKYLRARGSRSPIVRWMIRNHDEFAAILAESGVRWEAVAEYLGEHGLRTARGEVPTKRNVQKCWDRAQLAIAKQRAPKPSAETSGQAKVDIWGMRSGEQSPPATGPSEPAFKPVRMRNGGRGVSATERRALGDPTAPTDPNDPQPNNS